MCRAREANAQRERGDGEQRTKNASGSLASAFSFSGRMHAPSVRSGGCGSSALRSSGCGNSGVRRTGEGRAGPLSRPVFPSAEARGVPPRPTRVEFVLPSAPHERRYVRERASVARHDEQRTGPGGERERRCNAAAVTASAVAHVAPDYSVCASACLLCIALWPTICRAGAGAQSPQRERAADGNPSRCVSHCPPCMARLGAAWSGRDCHGTQRSRGRRSWERPRAR